MKIALAQINPIIYDFKGNAEKVLYYINKAIKTEGALDLIVFPELCFCGYPPRDLLLRDDFIFECIRSFNELIMRIPDGIGVIIGSISREERLFNSAFFIQNKQVIHKVNKSLLPEYDVFDEKRYFSPCRIKVPVLYKGLRIGITICEDIWIEEQNEKAVYDFNPLNELHKHGIDLLVNISASPYTIDKPAERQCLIKKISEKYNVPLIYVNTVGANDSLIFDGFSMAYHHKTGFLVRMPGFQEDLAFFDTNVHKIHEAIEHSKCENIINALILGVRDYMAKTGFKKVVIGLSGGLDSAVTAFIASKAAGGPNVLCISMPSIYSSKAGIKDAEELARNLNTEFKIIPINKIYNSYISSFEDCLPFDPEVDITYQNLQARIRGNILMAFSNRENRLVLTTGNKSELSVGYSTLYGDMAGGLSVLSDITKTDIYKVADYINKDRAIIPGSIISKPPSAELRPGQKDSDELPSYDQLDRIIKKLVERSESIDSINKDISEEIVRKFLRLFEKAEFKRQQAPLGLKISSKAFGHGRRFPIAMKHHY